MGLALGQAPVRRFDSGNWRVNPLKLGCDKRHQSLKSAVSLASFTCRRADAGRHRIMKTSPKDRGISGEADPIGGDFAGRPGSTRKRTRWLTESSASSLNRLRPPFQPMSNVSLTFRAPYKGQRLTVGPA